MRAGETLSSIARRHGMPVSTLARLNNLEPGDTLVKGQRLVIKASARRYRDEGVVSGRRVLYTVRRGDTVFSISQSVSGLGHAAQELERAEQAPSDQSRTAAGHVRRCRTGSKGVERGAIMGFLNGKRALIVGLATDRSIAWGIAQAMHREGAELAFSHIERMTDRVVPLAKQLGSDITFAMDVADDEDIARGFAHLKIALGCLRHPGARGGVRAARGAHRHFHRGHHAARAFAWRTTSPATA